MSKKKKDSNLSVAERLEQALIPDWDEPYKLPDNWCWTTIGNVANLYRGVSYKKQDGHNEKEIGDCLILRGGNINEGSINTEQDTIYVSKQLVSKYQYIKKYDVSAFLIPWGNFIDSSCRHEGGMVESGGWNHDVENRLLDS